MVNTSSADLPLLVVAAALIDGGGRLLVQRRPAGTHHGGLWEFPGGKVEPGETAEAALVREIEEELSVTIHVADLVATGFATTVNGAGRPLILLLFRTHRWKGTPRALEADAIVWYSPEELANLPMPPADYPLAAVLAKVLRA